MTAAVRNILRLRAIAQSRQVKELFLGDNGELKRAGEAVLADLRDFSFATKSCFDKDALVMARREGRREVFLRLANFLNLDEGTVEQLMEVDDGL
jgi:hypothetical protein